MTGALNLLRKSAVELLKECGLYAVTAMDAAPRKRWDGPVVAVSISRVVCAPGGFRDYLGLRTDPDSGVESELYGRGVELTVALDIYASREGGERACQETMAVLAEAVACRGLGGLTALEVNGGRVEFLEKDGLYRLPVTCLCKGWLVARVDNGGAFVDIEVRGRTI